MITTGVPVTVAIYQWLSQYAAERPYWFNSSDENFVILKKAFHEPLSSFELSKQNELHDFFRWLGVLLASFNGGIFSGDLTSFADRGDTVSLTWSNGITQTIALKGWDRQTRNAMDYIVKRSCAIENFQNDIPKGLAAMGPYLRYFKNQLSDHVEFSTTVTPSSIDVALKNDPSIAFLILSAVPVLNLQQFYVQFATLFPDDLSFEGLAEPMAAQMFFAKPVMNEMLVIDKVKMHYNLVFHATINNELLEAMSLATTAFIQEISNDSSLWAKVQDEIACITNDQFSPRLLFLNLVLDLFWPT